jgi:hypothetical protein
MIVVDGPDGEEVTGKIDDARLAELVETTTTPSHQRITSRIPAATLDGLLEAPAPATVRMRAARPRPVPPPQRAPTLVSVQPPPLPRLPTELPAPPPPPPRASRRVARSPAPQPATPPQRHLRSSVVVAISCVSTLVIGLVAGALLL